MIIKANKLGLSHGEKSFPNRTDLSKTKKSICRYLGRENRTHKCKKLLQNSMIYLTMDCCKRKKVLISGGQGKPNSLNLYLLLRDHQNRSVSCSLLPASLSAQCLTASAKLGAFHCASMSRSHFSECLVSWDNLEMLNKFFADYKDKCLPMQG